MRAGSIVPSPFGEPPRNGELEPCPRPDVGRRVFSLLGVFAALAPPPAGPSGSPFRERRRTRTPRALSLCPRPPAPPVSAREAGVAAGRIWRKSAAASGAKAAETVLCEWPECTRRQDVRRCLFQVGLQFRCVARSPSDLPTWSVWTTSSLFLVAIYGYSELRNLTTSPELLV